MAIDRINSAEQFADTDEGWAQRWTVEMAAAEKSLKDFHSRGKNIWKRYIDDRDDGVKIRRVNLFHSDTEIKRALLYGKVPQVEVSRRFSDANDDVARVGAETMERLLNTDIERDSDTCAEALKNALLDWLVPGMGVVRLRYEFESEPVEGQDAIVDPKTGRELAPAVPPTERRVNEEARIDYVPWDDFRWGPCRVWHDAPWIGFRVLMTRGELIERFGADIGRTVPLNAKKRGDENAKADPWSRADVWEIWSKDTREVFWWVKGYHRILDRKPDPLELEAFWPCPRPLFANITTEKLLPTPDYAIAQDLYEGIDALNERICLLEDAIRVAGVYDQNSAEVQNLVKHTGQNKLYPVSNWAMFAEKGGIQGAIDWLPLDMIAGALDKLAQQKDRKIMELHQVTGMADIMRGAAQQSATATEQSIKAKFGSIRSQDKQDEFARFVTDTMKLKAEIISRHFDPQTIVARSNMDKTPDAQLLPQAIELIKDKLSSCYRIQVKPEQISMTDYASLKQERTEFLQSLPAFFTAMVPLAQALPGSTPIMLQIIQWAMAGLKGSSSIEGVLDQAIAQATQAIAQQAQQPPKPDPAMVREQMKLKGQEMKAQADMQKTQMELQADLTRIGAETQAENAKQLAQMQMSVAEEQARAEIRAATPRPTNGRAPGGGQ